ncbi:MAG: hypothetical protein IPL46_30350 [Saprospiraceae bacterium]|nr:hypothetical protein [Saprospiraceae bacterium]
MIQNRILSVWKTLEKEGGVKGDGDSSVYSFYTTAGAPTTSATKLLYPHRNYRYEMRIDSATYSEVSGTTHSNLDRYSTTYTYNPRGNFTGLTRRGASNDPGTTFDQIDNMAYTYYGTSNVSARARTYKIDLNLLGGRD